MENKKLKNEISDDRQKDELVKFDSQPEFNQSFIDDLTKIKQHGTTAPTYTPKKFIDQIYFYDDGVDRKLYLYINNTWRSTTLT